MFCGTVLAIIKAQNEAIRPRRLELLEMSGGVDGIAKVVSLFICSVWFWDCRYAASFGRDDALCSHLSVLHSHEFRLPVVI